VLVQSASAAWRIAPQAGCVLAWHAGIAGGTSFGDARVPQAHALEERGSPAHALDMLHNTLQIGTPSFVSDACCLLLLGPVWD
jgi:hypothetical protein